MKKIFFPVFIHGLFLTTLFLNCKNLEFPKADLVFRNGYIHTVDKGMPKVDAVATLGDRILAAGSFKQIEKYISEKTRVIDLQGKLMIPGFNDSHLQSFYDHTKEYELDLEGVRNISEMLNRLLAVHRRDPYGRTWIVGRGWDQALFEDSRFPTSRDIDRMIRDRPVLLWHKSGHAALVNSTALDIAGINSETEDPPGGMIERDHSSGRPTGILKESAVDLMLQFLNPPDESAVMQGITEMLENTSRYGITSIQGRCDAYCWNILQQIIESGYMPCRIHSLFSIDSGLPFLWLRQSDAIPRFFVKGGIYVALDGDIGVGAASLYNAYTNMPGNFGIQSYSQKEINDLLLNAREGEISVSLGARGDEANTRALEALSFINKIKSSKNVRHRIDHADLVRDADMRRYGKMEAVICVQPWRYVDNIRWNDYNLGSHRSRNVQAWRSLKDSGFILSLGSYWPRGMLNPLYVLYSAVTRRDTTGYPEMIRLPEQRLTIEEAIEAYTLGSAWAEMMENEKGSITPGKLADLAVLDRNLLIIPPAEILETKVVMTVLGGKIVYQDSTYSE